MPTAVPYATDAGDQVIAPASAVTGGEYACLECRAPVSFRREHLRRGRTVAAHFSHKSGSECAGESVLHLAAKARLRQALCERQRPFVLRQTCSRWGCDHSWDHAPTLPDFDGAAEEVACGPYRLDVAATWEDQAVVGLEVYHSHRIGALKAQSLTLPWIELQAAPTAEDPYTWQAVTDGDIDDDEAWCLRARLRELDTTLTAVLNEWADSGRGPDALLHRLYISEKRFLDLFLLRHPQTNLFGPAHCADCTRVLEHFHRLTQIRQQEEALAATLELERQRIVFGPGLQRPFERNDAERMQRLASTLRFVLRYLPHRQRILHHLRAYPAQRLIARRCLHCEQPMLWVDTQGYLSNYTVYYPMIEQFRPDPAGQSFLIPVCLRCGARQKLSRLREGRSMTLWGKDLTTWVDAFRGGPSS